MKTTVITQNLTIQAHLGHQDHQLRCQARQDRKLLCLDRLHLSQDRLLLCQLNHQTRNEKDHRQFNRFFNTYFVLARLHFFLFSTFL